LLAHHQADDDTQTHRFSRVGAPAQAQQRWPGPIWA
jgi:hypothetical protein